MQLNIQWETLALANSNTRVHQAFLHNFFFYCSYFGKQSIYSQYSCTHDGYNDKNTCATLRMEVLSLAVHPSPHLNETSPIGSNDSVKQAGAASAVFCTGSSSSQLGRNSCAQSALDSVEQPPTGSVVCLPCNWSRWHLNTPFSVLTFTGWFPSSSTTSPGSQQHFSAQQPTYLRA